MAQFTPGLLSRFIDIQWFPDPVVFAERMALASERVSNLEEPLRASLPEITANVAEHFDEGGPGWAPWAVQDGPGPAMPYTRTYTGEALMVKSGETKEHATDIASYVVAGDSITYLPSGMDVLFHSSGPYYRNIWERPFIGLDEKGENSVYIIFSEWLQSIARGTGLPTGPETSAPGETFFRGGSEFFQPRSSLGTFLPGGRRL